eukprot:scaffold2547_cov299-Prasinococcus_capsulatus_cf.AAC.6
MCVHANVHACESRSWGSVPRAAGQPACVGGVRTRNGAVDDGAVLQLDGHRLVRELHQKPAGAWPPREDEQLAAAGRCLTAGAIAPATHLTSFMAAGRSRLVGV